MKINKEVIDEFQSQLRGQALVPGDEGYDTARTVWNEMINKYPALIVRCLGVADVMQAVKFARQHTLIVSVRGGGHNVAGKAVCDDGIMIDLSLMKSVRIDAANKIARVEPGATWADFNHEAQAFGLATTGGVVSHTGVAGLTLGGGLGWLMAQHGFTCDNLRSADVVTANGEFVRASAEDDAELFWALRGGGGNFGIVTSFEFQLQEVGPMVYGGAVFWPHSETKEVLRFYREFSASTPDELTAFAGLLCNPEGNPLVGIFAAWFGDLEEGQSRLEAVREFGTPVADMIGPLPYTALNMMFDEGGAFGMERYWKSGYVKELSNTVIDRIIEYTSPMPSPASIILLFHIHGAATRKDTSESAFGLREKVWDFDVVAQWQESAEAEKNITWARRFWKEIEPHTEGVYVNHIDADEGTGRVRTAYGDNFQRLVELKKKYDPDNFFRMNNNIPTTVEA